MLCLSEVLVELRKAGITATEQRVRYALSVGHVSKPRMGSDLRYRFSNDNLHELIAYFNRQAKGSVHRLKAIQA